MFHFLPARWLAALPTVVALSAFAQTAPAPADPRPNNPPLLSFHSALEGYRRYTDEKAIPWKEANDTTYHRGGWRAYAKEASDADASESQFPKSGASAPAGHSMPMPGAMPKKGQP